MEEKELDNILDILLDEDDNEPIELKDDKGNSVRFAQLAVIPDGDLTYAIMKPLDPFEDAKEDEAIVFFVDEEKNSLVIETDEEKAKKIFDEYLKMLDEED